MPSRIVRPLHESGIPAGPKRIIVRPANRGSILPVGRFYNGALTAAAVSGPEREVKWQQRWADARLFEAEPDPQREKYFVNFPYPYVLTRHARLD